MIKNRNTISVDSQLKYGVILSYVNIILNIFTGLLFTPWMIKVIGKSDYGLYALATSLISMLMLDFGLSAAVSRFVSKYLSENKPEKINSFLGIIYKLYLFIDLILLITLVVIFLLIDVIYINLTPYEIQTFKVIYAIVGVFSLISFPFLTLNGILTSYEQFIQLKVSGFFSKVLIGGLSIIALVTGYGLYALVLIHAFIGICIIIYKLEAIKKSTQIRINWDYKENHTLGEIINFSLWSTLSGIATRFILNISPSILGIVSGSASIAIFGVSRTLEGFIYTFSDAINGLFLPKVSRLILHPDSKNQILTLMIKVGRIQLSIVSLVFIGFVVLGKDFIFLWLGNDFSDVHLCTILIIAPSLISLTQQVAGLMTIALNKIKLIAITEIMTSFLNIVLSFIFGWQLGAIGIGLAILISMIIRLIIINILIYKNTLHLDIYKFFKNCHLKIMFPFIITFVLGVIIQKYIPIIGWLGLSVKGTLISLVYFIVLWFLFFNSFEKQLISNIVKHKNTLR